MRGFLGKDIYEAIVELGTVSRQLCSRTLDKDVLAEMKKEIPIILVKLENNFPLAFFDVMIHLAVHLPDEALLRCPMQYGWTYPIERRLYTLKRYVQNRSWPEGSITGAYVADECLPFFSKYIDDVDTKFNHKPRNNYFLVKKPVVLMFLGMELILLLRVNLYLRTMPLIKWCGLCSANVVKLRNMWSMF
jgi:hypothetical protein